MFGRIVDSSGRAEGANSPSLGRSLGHQTQKICRLKARAKPRRRTISSLQRNLAYNTGESFPSIVFRITLIGANPCFMNLSWKSPIVYAAPTFFL
jgi:hypothetical protein